MYRFGEKQIFAGVQEESHDQRIIKERKIE